MAHAAIPEPSVQRGESQGFRGGTGTINGVARGAGLLSPGLSGTASGIITANRLNPSDGMDLQFVFSGTMPTFTDSSNSTNDLVRLTANPGFPNSTSPFVSALTSSNSKTLYLNMTKAALGLGTIMTLVVGVPEPSTYALGLGGAGFLGLLGWSRQRRRPRGRA